MRLGRSGNWKDEGTGKPGLLVPSSSGILRLFDSFAVLFRDTEQFLAIVVH